MATLTGEVVSPQTVSKLTRDLDEALAWVREATTSRRALSIGLVGNAAEVLPALVERGITPDVLSDQTSAHDTLNGYVPAGLTLAAATENVGEAFHWPAVGKVARGYLADIVVVDDDPTRDIRNLEKIRLVIHGGEVVDRDALLK